MLHHSFLVSKAITQYDFGPKASLSTSAGGAEAICYDSVNLKTVAFYRYNATNIYASVLTIAGDGTITTGTPVNIVARNVSDIVCNYDVASGKILVFYSVGAGQAYGKVCTVSGTTISAGAEATVDSLNCTGQLTSCYDPISGKSVVGYRDSTTSKSRKSSKSL